LQILGLLTTGSGNPRNILKTLQELHNAQLFTPIVFTLERRRYTARIGIFPASVNRRATIPHELAQSFSKGNGTVDPRVATGFFELTIYLIDSSDMPSIYELAKDMAVSFPLVKWLNLWFEGRCEIVSFLLTVDDYNRT
jgi:hypothetical protein